MHRMVEAPSSQREPTGEGTTRENYEVQTGATKKSRHWREQLLNFGATPSQYERWVDRVLVVGLVGTALICFYIFFLAG